MDDLTRPAPPDVLTRESFIEGMERLAADAPLRPQVPLGLGSVLALLLGDDHPLIRLAADRRSSDVRDGGQKGPSDPL